MNSPWFLIAALSACAAVILGAVGGHAVEPDGKLASLQNTAVLYHFVHSFAIFVVAIMSALMPDRRRGLAVAGSLFCIGIVLFSGSLYLHALKGIVIGGSITPAGGVCFIAGWLVLALVGYKYWWQKS